MEVSSITRILRVAALLLALALSAGCERVLELGLSGGTAIGMDAGDDDDDGGGDASDSDTNTNTEPPDTDDPDGSTDGSTYDGAT